MRVAIYVRVSTQEQAEEGYSIQAQEEKLRAYCKARDWKVYKVYIDGGYSGSNTDRPGLAEMLTDIHHGNIEMVLVYKLDRLSRSQKDTLYLIEDVFLENHVDFISITENFDTSTPLGRAMIGILSVFAQLERERIKERMQLGLDARAKEGYFHGGGFDPVGYDYVDGELVINEYEAMQVRMVVDMYLNKDMNIHQISKYMNNNGYKLKYGSWDRHSNVRSILTTPIYNGWIIWKNDKFKGRHEALINDDEWKRIQEKIEKTYLTERSQSAFKPTTLLSGILWCGNCGARYYCKHVNGGHPGHYTQLKYYTCYSRGKSNKKMIVDPSCKNKTWNSRDLDKLVINEIKKLAFDKDYLNEKLEERDSGINPIVIDKRLKEINKQTNRLMELYQLDGIDFGSVKEKIEALSAERNSLIDEKEKAADLLNKPTAESIKSQLRDVDTVFSDETSLDVKRSFIRSLINRIEILDETVMIYWAFM